MVVLLVLIALTVRSFRRAHGIAAALMIPYGVWCLYAAYLNAGFLLLNHT
jgi:translocator protein